MMTKHMFLTKGNLPLNRTNLNKKNLKHMCLIQMREVLQAAAPIEGQAAPVPVLGPLLNEEAIKD